MQKELIIALESADVARWFATALRLYGRDKNIRIFLLLMNKKSRRQNWLEKFFFNRFFSFFGGEDLTRQFDMVPDASHAPLLGFVSGRSQNFLDSVVSEKQCLFLSKGSLFTSPGILGFWHYVVQFFAFGRPLVLDDPSKGIFYHAWFQTRTFKFARNIGYLRFNIEKILDHVLFDVPHGYPVSYRRFPKANLVKNFLVYPFREFYHKFSGKFIKPRWHLVHTTMKALTSHESFNGQCLDSGSDGGWADPFLVPDGNQLYLFAEHIEKGIGHITVSSLNSDASGIVGKPVSILKTGSHLSYPFVFNIEDVWYMIPESSAARELVIYKASVFPYKWERFRVVFDDEEWLDTTPFFRDGKWWIYSILKPVAYASSYQELHLFYCDDILHDEWISHPENPVVSDNRRARPGGPLFEMNGKLYRPGQNCFNVYGGRVSLCEVVTLSENEYEERVARELYFPWYSRKSSFHTISVAGNIVIGDCKF
jgi:hypothetical protein